ncbi:MAG: hypothetical protein ACOX9C_04130 [Kiritimatiellia bacterium]
MKTILPLFLCVVCANIVRARTSVTNSQPAGQMGGLCAVVAARTCGIPMSHRGSPQPYSSVLKDDPGGWHHHALVWNDEGLKDVKTLDGEVATFAVLVDGEKYSSRNFEGKPGSFRKMAEGPVLFCLSPPNSPDYRVVPFSIDELKIWNVDKTTFEIMP